MSEQAFTVRVETDDAESAAVEIERALAVWFHRPVKVGRLFGPSTGESSR